MKPREFLKWLAERGVIATPGKGSHLKLRRGKFRSVMPTHGELKTGTLEAIKRQLGLKDHRP